MNIIIAFIVSVVVMWDSTNSFKMRNFEFSNNYSVMGLIFFNLVKYRVPNILAYDAFRDVDNAFYCNNLIFFQKNINVVYEKLHMAYIEEQK